jgi:hypothetical protein
VWTFLRTRAGHVPAFDFAGKITIISFQRAFTLRLMLYTLKVFETWKLAS